ncbi:hypothetical protein KCU93_g327, partial [Aureobasidium melanogenum]
MLRGSRSKAFFIQLDRFGQKQINARYKSLFLCFRRPKACQCNYSSRCDIITTLECSYLTRGFKAIHDRHGNVHEYDFGFGRSRVGVAECSGFVCFKGFETVCRCVGFVEAVTTLFCSKLSIGELRRDQKAFAMNSPGVWTPPDGGRKLPWTTWLADSFNSRRERQFLQITRRGFIETVRSRPTRGRHHDVELSTRFAQCLDLEVAAGHDGLFPKWLDDNVRLWMRWASPLPLTSSGIVTETVVPTSFLLCTNHAHAQTCTLRQVVFLGECTEQLTGHELLRYTFTTIRDRQPYSRTLLLVVRRY